MNVFIDCSSWLMLRQCWTCFFSVPMSALSVSLVFSSVTGQMKTFQLEGIQVVSVGAPIAKPMPFISLSLTRLFLFPFVGIIFCYLAAVSLHSQSFHDSQFEHIPFKSTKSTNTVCVLYYSKWMEGNINRSTLSMYIKKKKKGYLFICFDFIALWVFGEVKSSKKSRTVCLSV